jgi:hypothetical protein
MEEPASTQPHIYARRCFATRVKTGATLARKTACRRST